jgi:hypothetical protein
MTLRTIYQRGAKQQCRIYMQSIVRCAGRTKTEDITSPSSCVCIYVYTRYLYVCICTPRRYPYFHVVVGLVLSHDPKSYADGSVCYW